MRRIMILIALLCLPIIGAIAQSPAKAKAMLTISFIRYIGWADEARQGDFVIGVVRDKEIATFMKEQSAGKKFGFQDVVVKEYKGLEDMEDCQVLYVSKNFNYIKNSNAIIDKVGKNTLIITELEGATTKGAMINFVVRDEKLKFEISKKNASFAGIQVSAKLETMSAAINL